VTAFLIFDLDAVDENDLDAVDDTDTIKTSNTSDDAYLQDETVDYVEQTDIENRNIHDDRIAPAEQVLILGISHETEGRSKEAIKSYEQAVQIEDETDRNDIKSKAYQHLGNLFTGTSENKKAIEFYQKAHEISPDLETKDKILQKEAYTNLVAIHYESCKFDAAVKSYLKVKEISHDLGERKEEANACLMLGDTFQELKQHEEAIKSYRTTLHISEELEDNEMQKVAMRRLATTYLMASICYKDCDYDKAIELRKKAIEWNEKTLDILGTEPSDHLLHEKAFTGLGIDWFNLGDTEKAMESIHEAQNVAKNTDTGSYYTLLYFVGEKMCDAKAWVNNAINTKSLFQH
jgi:tetratricopeptide (TPR) repeat protein